MNKGRREVKRDPKTRLVILSPENAGNAFLEWREGIITYINSEDTPDDYRRADKYSEHLTKSVAEPTLGDFTTLAEGARAEALRIQSKRWSSAESIVKGKVTRHIEGYLRDVFDHSATCYEGWKNLSETLSYDKESQVDRLEQELASFAQSVNESDIAYAERFDALLYKLKSVDRPNAREPAVVEEFNRSATRKFWLGLRRENRKGYGNKLEGKSFREMKTIIVLEDRDDSLSQVQC